MLNYRPFFIIGEVKQPGGYPYVLSRRSRWPAAFTYRARDNEILIRRAGDPTQRQKPAGRAKHDRSPCDVEVRQRFF